MLAILLLFVVVASSQADFDCVDVCRDTYPTHTYPKSDHQWACMRGCRFYVVEKLTLNDPFAMVADYDSSSSQCNSSCIDAYKLDSSSRYACQIGCGQTESSVLITTATPVATGAQDVPFSVVLEVGRLGFFAARQGTLFSNVASVWRMENGWVIVSFSNQEVEPTTAAPTVLTSCQGWLQGSLPQWFLLTLCGLTILLVLTLVCASTKPKKRNLSIQADDLPLVKKPAVLGSLADKKGCVTVV